MKAIRKILSVCLVLLLAIGAALPVAAADGTAPQSAVSDAAAYVYAAVPDPQVGSIGGEWAVIGLARSGYDVPDAWFESYYKTVEQVVKDRNGVLDTRKYTEYSRVILGLTAAGYDPRNVAGYDLTLPLGDFEKTVWQGLNGPIFALIALDSLNYPIPKNPGAKTQATRALYIQEILCRQTPDGGWNLTAGSNGTVGADEKADPDVTGMALQALAKYQNDPAVAGATVKALECLSSLQNADGGFSSWSTANSESLSQVITALSELGIGTDDPRFVKNGKTLVDALISFRSADGSFKHTADGSGVNQMATEQAFYALADAERAQDSRNSLYRMDDAKRRGAFAPVWDSEPGLPGKDPNVKWTPITESDKTFPDIAGHPNEAAIEELVLRGIIDGLSDGTFSPDLAMTRAEFAAIIVRALGLTPTANGAFADIPASAWYAGYVGTASAFKIADGVEDGKFSPEGTITREAAATMVARAARLCGLDTAMSDMEIRNMLTQFTDYVTVDSWARESAAFCYGSGILNQSDIEIRPMAAIKRCEIAQMVTNMLAEADLL